MATPLTAEQSYALGTREGRDRINQQLRANPQYSAYLRSIGADPNGSLSDAQREQAAAWVRQNIGPIGGLEIDAAGNLNNPHGFAQELKQWGPIAAAAGGIAAAPFLLPVLGAGAAGGGTGATGGALASSSLPASLSMYGPAAIASQGASLLPGAAAATGAGGGGMGLWGNIMKGINKGSDLLGMIGAGTGAYAAGEAANRGSKLDAQIELERLLMQRERDRFNEQLLAERAGRESGTDAWRKLIAGQRMLAPGPQPMLSPYSTPVRSRTAAERAGADAMTQEVMKRLQGGNPIVRTPERSMNVDLGLTDPGLLERIFGIAAPVGTYIGTRNRPIYQVTGQRST